MAMSNNWSYLRPSCPFAEKADYKNFVSYANSYQIKIYFRNESANWKGCGPATQAPRKDSSIDRTIRRVIPPFVLRLLTQLDMRLPSPIIKSYCKRLVELRRNMMSGYEIDGTSRGAI